MASSSPPTGAINEDRSKEVGELARLLHSVWGLYHYPRYLERWQDDEVGELESQLMALLVKVRSQRAAAREYRCKLASAGGDAAKKMRSAAAWRVDQVVEPSLAKALRWSRTETMASALDNVRGKPRGLSLALSEVDDAVCELAVLRPEFCQALVAALDEVTPIDVSTTFPRANFDHLGFGWIADLLLVIARAVTDQAFDPATVPDWRHAYALDYSRQGPRTSLVSHTDDSELTLNILLTDDFEGGHLLLGGRRGDQDETKELMPLPARSVGRAICHIGRHLHAVEPVRDGHRRVLICWTRANRSLRSSICPCCWMNRRFGDSYAGDCICGAAWNT